MPGTVGAFTKPEAPLRTESLSLDSTWVLVGEWLPAAWKE